MRRHPLGSLILAGLGIYLVLGALWYLIRGVPMFAVFWFLVGVALLGLARVVRS